MTSNGDRLTGDDTLPERVRLVFAVCTYRRNQPLERLLLETQLAADRAASLCTVEVVVIDDNDDRRAQAVVDDVATRVNYPLHYRSAGFQNISIARNLGLDAALELGDWLVMTDDDCVPDVDWFVELIECQRRTAATAVSGRLVRRAPVGGPRWIGDGEILQQGVTRYATDSIQPIASTHNSMISVDWLRAHPEQRFDERYGRIGGEDMMFFKAARQSGLQIRYSAEAVVYEDQPPDRLTFRFVAWHAMWLGNSSYVTHVEAGTAGRPRMLVHGLAQVMRGVTLPLRQLIRRKSPALPSAATQAAGGVGLMLGVLGVRLKHH